MFFRQLATRDATLSYFFGCGSCGVSVAVDPVAGDEDWFVDQAAQQNVKITHIIDTHVHADHYSGGRALQSGLVRSTACTKPTRVGSSSRSAACPIMKSSRSAT